MKPFCAHCTEESGELTQVKIDGRFYQLCSDCEAVRLRITLERQREKRPGGLVSSKGKVFA